MRKHKLCIHCQYYKKKLDWAFRGCTLHNKQVGDKDYPNKASDCVGYKEHTYE